MFSLPWRDMYEVGAVTGSYLTATATGGETKSHNSTAATAASGPASSRTNPAGGPTTNATSRRNRPRPSAKSRATV